MAKNNGHIMKTTLAVTLVITFSKAVGFLREMIMAYYFGRNMATDAYNSAYSLFYLPVLLFSSCVTSTLVPMYIRRENALGRDNANAFASNTLNLFAAFALMTSVLMMLFAPALVKVVYPGFEGEAFTLTVRLSRIMFPALCFFVISVILSTVLNAQEHYLAAQLTGLPLSAALIAAAVVFTDIEYQAWGIIAAGILQIIILCPVLFRGFRYSFSFDLYDKGFRRLMKLALPAVLAMAVNELNHMIDRMLASTLNTGDISAMSYAFKLIMFMLGVLVVPLTTISFSKMSRKAAGKNRKALVSNARNSVELLMAVILPITAIACVCSTQIIRLAYGRGQFDDASVIITGQVFMFYALGVPFFGARDMLNRVFHSLQDTKTPMRIACASMAINVVLNLALRKVMGVNGLAFATSVAALSGVIMLAVSLNKRLHGMFSRRFRNELIKICVATLAALGCGLFVSNILPDWRGTARVFSWLVAVGASSLATYILACAVLDVRQITKLLRPRKRS